MISFNIFKKILLLVLLFVLINLSLFIYLKHCTIAFRPLHEKSLTLLHKYPSSNIIIGGDSIAEEGIDPRIISPNTINIAIAGGGLSGPLKAIQLYRKNGFSDNKLIILNLSILNQNDAIINGNLFLNQADTFLDIGFLYLLSSWREKFFENLFTLYQCRFSSCPLTLDNLLTLENFNKTIAQKGFMSSANSISSRVNIKEIFKTQYKSFYDKKFDINGEIFKNYQKHLKELSRNNVMIAIVLMPISDSFKLNISEFGTNANIQSFLSAIEKECLLYSNCKSFNYSTWNNHNLGDAKNTDEYFSDYMHLNSLGSRLFTNIFLKDLKKSHFVN